MIVEVCVGSACHIKGSQDIVELLQSAIETHQLEGEVILVGSFCTGKCNREGVTITVDNEVFTGITRETFKDFLDTRILARVREGQQA